MTRPLKFLIVEDEALILMQLEALVEDAGHLVVGSAMHSAEAIDLARIAQPDIAFIDLNLANGDSGLAVAQALEDVLVVFVTANSLRLGNDFATAAGVIAKPFSRAVIAHAIPYLEECIRHPPPVSTPPNGMQMAPQFLPSPILGKDAQTSLA